MAAAGPGAGTSEEGKAGDGGGSKHLIGLIPCVAFCVFTVLGGAMYAAWKKP